MNMVQRWLDPPEAVARKRLLRGTPRGGSEFEMGCLVPIGLALAVAIGIGVLVGMRMHEPMGAPGPTIVRVIDDGAKPGPKVLATVIVPAR